MMQSIFYNTKLENPHKSMIIIIIVEMIEDGNA